MTPQQRSSLAAGLALVMALPTVGEAQLTGAFDITSGLGHAPHAAWQRETRLLPAVQLARSFGFLNASSTVIERSGVARVARTSLDGGALSPAAGPLRFVVQARLTQDSAGRPFGDPAATATAALSAKLGAAGVWLGAEGRSGARPGVVAGAWGALGGAVISIHSSRHHAAYSMTGFRLVQLPGWDTIPSDSGWLPVPRYRTDTVRSTRLSSWSDLEARVDWGVGRWTLSAAFAGRPGRDSVAAQMWGRVQAAVRISPYLFLTAGAGSVPHSTASRAAAPGRFATLGVRVSPWAIVRDPLPAGVRPTATAFTAVRLAEGQVRVVLRVPAARSVEIAGDFNQWTPIALQEGGANLWEVTLALPAGTHRVSIRVDGDRWVAPPGVPAVDDEFNGRVGLIVLR